MWKKKRARTHSECNCLVDNTMDVAYREEFHFTSTINIPLVSLKTAISQSDLASITKRKAWNKSGFVNIKAR